MAVSAAGEAELGRSGGGHGRWRLVVVAVAFLLFAGPLLPADAQPVGHLVEQPYVAAPTLPGGDTPAKPALFGIADCPDGETGIYPACVPQIIPCPPLTQGTFPDCRPIPCRAGFTGYEPVCIKETCPAGQIGDPPNCKVPTCPEGQEGTPPDCHPVCPTGRIGTPPDCKCPAGNLDTGTMCIAVTGGCSLADAAAGTCNPDLGCGTFFLPCITLCPIGQVGFPPNCTSPLCPPGQTGTPPNCVTPPSCPEGQTGTPPNCTTPTCPTGKTGTPPNCKCFDGSSAEVCTCPPGTIDEGGGHCGELPKIPEIPTDGCIFQFICDRPCPLGQIDLGFTCIASQCPSQLSVLPCATEQCPDGQTGTPPNCTPTTCPEGQTGTPPDCAPTTCPNGYQPPTCAPPTMCPNGYQPPTCAPPPSCPSGQTGTPPSCVTPTCPTGQTGTPPSCVTPVVVTPDPPTPTTPTTPGASVLGESTTRQPAEPLVRTGDDPLPSVAVGLDILVAGALLLVWRDRRLARAEALVTQDER